VVKDPETQAEEARRRGVSSTHRPVFIGRRPLNRHERLHVDALRDRAAWLVNLIAKAAPGNSMSYARAELSALRWAIEQLSDTAWNESIRVALNAALLEADGP